ncbi:MAG TPA: PrsW family intramembrane metalloprotease [Gryllotalpicola sp.]
MVSNGSAPHTAVREPIEGIDVSSSANQPVPSRAPWHLRVLWPILAAATWLASMVYIATQLGVSGLLIGAVLSAILAALIVGVILWLGRWTPREPRLLVSAFVWGASIAAFCALWSQNGLQALVDGTLGVDAGRWIRPLIITPVTEEGFKGLFLVWLLVFHRRRIGGLLGGIVYGGLVGAGFSLVENSLYLGGAVTTFLHSDTSDPRAIATLAATLVLRVVLVPLMHPFLVAITGLGVAAAAAARRRGARVALVLAGLLIAMALHGAWDWAGLAASDPYLIYKIYAAVMLPMFLAVVILGTSLRRRQRRRTATTLAV